MKCHICGTEFFEASKRSKYCSRECKWKAQRFRAKQKMRNKIGYYDRRIQELTESGFVVINPIEYMKKFPALQLSDDLKVEGSLPFSAGGRITTQREGFGFE